MDRSYRREVMTDDIGPSADEDDPNAPGEVVVERLSPGEAFGVVSHKTRLRVLEVLNETDEPLAFADLRRRVGADDPSGFNYHLGKLAGRFVQNTDEGYELADPGGRIVGAVLSGGYTKAMDADPVPVDGTCTECGGSLEARFHEDGVRVVCIECGFAFTDPEIPAGALEGVVREQVPMVVDRWLKRVHAAAEHGFCPNCDGRLDRRVTLPSDDGSPEWLTGEDLDVTVIYDCRRCGTAWQSIVPYAVFTHSAIIAFHYDHDIDLRETPDWNLDWPRAGAATVMSADPLRIDLAITLDGETRVFTFDENLDVVTNSQNDK